MAVTTAAVSVTTSATALLARSYSRSSAVIHVPSGGSTVYVGGSNVTTSTGIPVTAGNTFSLSQGHRSDPAATFEFYGIVASGTQDVRVLSVNG